MIPNDPRYLCRELNFPRYPNELSKDIAHLATVFPKLSVDSEWIQFLNFNELHNFRKSHKIKIGNPGIVPEKEKRREREREEKEKKKTDICINDSQYNDPLPLDFENAYQWFREYYQARTGKAVLEVAGRKAFSANIKNFPEIIEFKRAIEGYFLKDPDALKGFAYGPEKLLWNWRTYIPTKVEIVALEAREAAKRAEIEAARVEQRTCTCGVTYKTTKGDDFKACPACRERSRKEAIKKAGDMVRGLSEKFKA